MIRFITPVGALLALAISPTSAFAHAQLSHASPAVGSTVSLSPGQVTLTFTEKLEPKFSGAFVKNAAGQRVDSGSTVSGSTIHVGVKSLGAGFYTVTWHVLSVDTHKTQGTFNFKVGK